MAVRVNNRVPPRAAYLTVRVSQKRREDGAIEIYMLLH
jgi:hypothetical protein